MADFNVAYDKTMKIEGGYTNNPADKGGETYGGISRKFFPNWSGWKIIDETKGKQVWEQLIENNQQLKSLQRSFYKQEFWDKLYGDKIASEIIAHELFDTAVNMGSKASVEFLQRSLNIMNRNGKLYSDIVSDGVMGDGTIQTLKKYLAVDVDLDLLVWMNVLQGMRYIQIMEKDRTQETFARGWSKRILFYKS